MTNLHVLRPHVPTGPLTRGECREWVLPCNLTGCRYNMRHQDVRAHGPGRPYLPFTESAIATFRSCVLNAAEEPPAPSADGEDASRSKGGAWRSQGDVAAMLGCTKQAIDNVEHSAYRRLAKNSVAMGLYKDSKSGNDATGAVYPNTDGLEVE